MSGGTEVSERAEAFEQEVAPADGGRRRRRPLRASLLLLTALAVVGGAGAAATGALGGDGGSAAPGTAPASGATAEVERATLTRTETVEGALGYGEETTVRDTTVQDTAGGPETDGRAKGGDTGVVTWLPAEGATLERGDTVYGVDGRKVPLLYGATPLYRTLKPGSEGKDVEMLEKNLAALGHSGFTADDSYTPGTAAAVRDWQRDLDREETGETGPGDAVVAEGARRVMELKTSPGGTSGGELLTWTGTERVVTVALEARFEELVEDGTKATVELPDGATTGAEVTAVGTAGGSSETPGSGGENSGESGGEQEGDEEATLPVELKVPRQKDLGRYQAAAVDVELKAESRENVLAVPVNALTARSGGGYALEVRGRGGRSEHRPVEPGMFANGKVEVSGKGIAEGLTVGVAE